MLDVAAWETWGLTADGWGWGRPPTVVLPGRFGELSLRRVEDRWVLVMFDDGNYRMDVLVLDSPVADLHTAPRATVLQGVGWDDEDHAAGRVAQLYGGYVAARQHAGRPAPRGEPVEHHDELALPRHAVRGGRERAALDAANGVRPSDARRRRRRRTTRRRRSSRSASARSAPRVVGA